MTLSVYRSPQYNKKIGGATQSQHMKFTAIDFQVKANSSPAQWAGVLRQMRQSGLFKGGIGVYPSFVHVDTRGVDRDW
jgi:lysozyme